MSRRWLRDSAERVVVTFLEAFFGALHTEGIVDLLDSVFDDVPGNLDFSGPQAAWVAGVTASLAAVKAILAKLKGDRQSASLVQ